MNKQHAPIMKATTFDENKDHALSEEMEKIYQSNKTKMIQMKSKLLGLKTNIEKHGEQMGVTSKFKGKPNRTAQEVA